MTTNPPLPNFSLDLTGQVAFVTGTTSGLGHRFARVLAAAGAQVAVAARRTEKLDRLVAEIAADGASGIGSGSALAVPLDVSDSAAVFAAIARVEDELGKVQILVNNAGIPDAMMAHKMSPEFVDHIIATNVTGPFHLSCEVARRLMGSGLSGRIVNISSMGAFQAGIGTSMYAVTKTAIARMSEMHALEWARHHINVNTISPGAFSSEMMDGMLERLGDITQGFPRKRLGDPSQLDSTLLFLCSPSSEFVTGTNVKVHDGQSAG
ncbi:MAG: SDR family NAD(P)-dependent oxidoreductase [Acidimicrobiales bacterium]|jgi:NAD(P)-dependent dehydrogenase (short-subunit alcohol dehydrogenase family)